VSFLERVLALAGRPGVAIVDERGETTFAALVDRALAAAASLGAPLGGRRVALLAPQDADWVAAFLGVVLGGGVAVPLSPAYPAADLDWFVADAGATLVTAPRELLSGPRARPAERGETALLLYTSGTTGRPKGARITHANLDAQTALLAGAWALSPGDRLLHALPLHHLHGLVVSLLSVLLAGGRVTMLPRFDAARVADELGRATVFMAVPAMYHRLRERGAPLELAALRLATSGSAALPVSLAAWWRDLHGAIPLERYGMTEIGVALSNPLDPAGRRAGHVGLPLPGIEVKLDDGELLVRGPTVFAGYHAREVDPFEDGWFRTGDVAAFDADGGWRLLGRTSTDILKSGGEKISALHIEEVLRAHPAVADAAVIGLPDERWGDRVIAAVEARRGVTPAELEAHARARLAAHEVPKEFFVVDALPRNPLGKVVKPELTALVIRWRA
jgi:malonyl-CoA/methylmalonyl-CoA synthetase